MGDEGDFWRDIKDARKDETRRDRNQFRNVELEEEHRELLEYLSKGIAPFISSRAYGIYNRLGGGLHLPLPRVAYLVNLCSNEWLCSTGSVEFERLKGEASGYYKRIAEEKLNSNSREP